MICGSFWVSLEVDGSCAFGAKVESNLKDAKEFIQKCIDENLLHFGILYKGDFCGVIGFTLTEDACLVDVELGYWLGEPFWGKGIATQAIKLITTYGLEQVNFDKIRAVVLEYNPSSMRVLEKAGFYFSRITKDTGSRHGVPFDEYHYEIERGGIEES